MDAEILHTIPLSGTYHEKHFDVNGDSTWVKFIDNAEEEWCGVFGLGISGHTSVDIAPSVALAFVVSGGRGYLVDVSARTVMHRTTFEKIVEARFIPGSRKVVACDWTNIYVIEGGAVAWDSGRISVDGITFDEVTERTLLGRVNNLSEDWPHFTLDLRTLEYECPWTCLA